MDSVSEVFFSKVNDEAKFFARDAKLGQALGKMNGIKVVNGFHFNDHKLPHQQIEAIKFFKRPALIDHWDINLPGMANVPKGQLRTEGFL